MNRRTSRLLGLAVAAGVVLAGCSDARQERLEGAQRALAALPDVEIVQRDAAAGVLTVRSRRSGVVSTIDVMSKWTPAGVAAVAANAGDAATSDAAAGPGGRPAGAVAAFDESTAAGSVPGSPDPRAGTVAPGTAAMTDEEPGARGASEDDVAPGAGSVSVPLAATATVVRDPQGRVQKIEGSGFSIERAPGPARPAAADRAPTAGIAPAAATAGAKAGERRRMTVPFVCGAGEARTLQGVELDVPGAGIVAQRGCTLTLANVRVRSGGWGLVVNPGATVRIDDSLIEGRTGALDLHPGASLSAWATTFRGALGRPVATPQFIDRGGNAWE